MSASLVGSEMCIRDSLSPSHSPWASSWPQMGFPSASTKAGTTPVLAKSCLLYTSDAADDM
eukprot:12349604-Alexandrium_andersonii.AAC.1